MQRTALRRPSRRAQSSRTGVGQVVHTSALAATASNLQLSANYLATLEESVHLAQVEQGLWANDVLSAATEAREVKHRARREALEEAGRRLEQQQHQQQEILARRDAEKIARANEFENRQRQEAERIIQDHEEENRRRREEQAIAETAQQRAVEEAERRRRERLRPCVICMDDNDFSLMVQTPCTHWYCGACLKDGFEASLASRSRYQCCQQHVPTSLIAEVLSRDFIERYEMMVLEQSTPNPTYCANSTCAAFIPPANYHGPDSAHCDKCETETCRHCQTSSHTGRGCTTDTATQQLRALAAIVGWKTCPACTTMVERRDGCLHMTCRCGAEFCYRCSGYWRECESRCAGQYF